MGEGWERGRERQLAPLPLLTCDQGLLAQTQVFVSLPQGERMLSTSGAISPPAAGLHPDQEAPERQQPDHSEDHIHDGLRQRRPAPDQRRGEGRDGHAIGRERRQQPEDAERDPQGRPLPHPNGP